MEESILLTQSYAGVSRLEFVLSTQWEPLFPSRVTYYTKLHSALIPAPIYRSLFNLHFGFWYIVAILETIQSNEIARWKRP